MVRQFCDERNWEQFHGPKDLAIGIVTEGSELLDHFRFQNDSQSKALLLDPHKRQLIGEELADVFYFVLRFADLNGLDLATVLSEKLKKNAEKYPKDLSYGSNLSARDLHKIKGDGSEND